MSIQDIEVAITQLPAEEVAELTSWLIEYHHQLWDRQIENDLDTGRLEGLLDDLENEYQSGSVQPL